MILDVKSKNRCVVFLFYDKDGIVDQYVLDMLDDLRENAAFVYVAVNGVIQKEPNPQKQTLPYTEGVTFPITLKKGEIFLLGDDRENSADSRVYGAVNQDDTLGKVLNIVRRRNF